MLELVSQYLRLTIDENGLYSNAQRGISLGCSLSPLLGALYLDVLDRRMEARWPFYAHFIDDWVILPHTHWALRRAVRLVNQTLADLRLERHPDKTFIGRTVRGFEFLGYRMSAEGIVGMARASIRAFQERVARLYEQNASPEMIQRGVVQYVRRLAALGGRWRAQNVFRR